MIRAPLPDELGPAFTVADARSLGVGEKRMRAADLSRPFRGVRARQDHADGPSPDARASQHKAIVEAAAHYALRMGEHEFFSHSTAALLWGAPLPLLRDGRPHVSVLAPRRLGRAAGIHAHEAQPHLTRVLVHPETGLSLAGPATSWAMAATELQHPYDLVAAADGLVRVPRMPGGFDKRMPPPVTTLDQLHAAVGAGRRVGAAALRYALTRVRTGSSSRPETWVRLTLVDAGIPEPELDVDVFDGDGRFVGCVDLAYPTHRVALEYEGDHHRTDRATWNRDIDKHDRLAARGSRVIRITESLAFHDSHALVARTREALRR